MNRKILLSALSLFTLLHTSAYSSYINVDGKLVESPIHSPTIPTGAKAICRDKTFSFSHHLKGTCSKHGGVMRRLENEENPKTRKALP